MIVVPHVVMLAVVMMMMMMAVRVMAEMMAMRGVPAARVRRRADERQAGDHRG